MRYLRWVGLMSSLLFVGVLGGLMAPLPSEAVPTLTVKIDGVQVAPVAAAGGNPAVPTILIAANSTCNAAEVVLGYTACYAIRTSNTTTYPGNNGRLWKIQTVAGLSARLRIADLAGRDAFSLVGIRFVPVPWTTSPQTATADQNTNEQHIIEVIMRNAFTSPLNVNNAASIATDGGYIWAMRTGGEFSAGPTGSNCNLVQGDNLCDAIGDKVEFTGTGVFTGAATHRVDILSPADSASGQNIQPLSFTVAGPHADPILSFAGITNADMAQVDPMYPRFDCAKAGALTTCQPDIIQTLKITLLGPDTFVLVGGGDGDGSHCTLTPDEQKTLKLYIKILTGILNALTKYEANPNNPPNAGLHAFIVYLQTILTAATQPPSDQNCPGAVFVKIAQAIQQANDQLAFLLHNAKPAVGVSATGTITINKNTSIETQASFHFTITGSSGSSDSVIPMGGTSSSSIVVPVTAGTYSVSEVLIAGWTPNGIPDCDDSGSTENFVVTPGGNVQCYFGNTKDPEMGTIKIIKNVNPCPLNAGCDPNPLNGNFGFTVSSGDNVNIVSIPTSGGTGQTSVQVPAGTYSVVESNSDGFHPVDAGQCDTGRDGGNTNVVVAPNATVTCTFSNDPVLIN